MPIPPALITRAAALAEHSSGLFKRDPDQWASFWTHQASHAGAQRGYALSAAVWLLALSGLPIPEAGRIALEAPRRDLAHLWSDDNAAPWVKDLEKVVLGLALDQPEQVNAEAATQLMRQVLRMHSAELNNPLYRRGYDFGKHLLRRYGKARAPALRGALRDAALTLDPAEHADHFKLLNALFGYALDPDADTAPWPAAHDPLIATLAAKAPYGADSDQRWAIFCALPKARREALVDAHGARLHPSFTASVPSSPARCQLALERLSADDPPTRSPESLLRFDPDHLIPALLDALPAHPTLCANPAVAAALRFHADRVPLDALMPLLGHPDASPHAVAVLAARGPEAALAPTLKAASAASKTFPSRAARDGTKAAFNNLVQRWCWTDTGRAAVDATAAALKLTKAQRKLLQAALDLPPRLPPLAPALSDARWRATLAWKRDAGPCAWTHTDPDALPTHPHGLVWATEALSSYHARDLRSSVSWMPPSTWWACFEASDASPTLTLALAALAIDGLVDQRARRLKRADRAVKPDRDALWAETVARLEAALEARGLGDRWAEALGWRITQYRELRPDYGAKHHACNRIFEHTALPLQAYLDLFRRSAELRAAALERLRADGARAARAVLPGLHSRQQDARIFAAATLEAIGHRDAAPHLRQALERERGAKAKAAMESALRVCDAVFAPERPSMGTYDAARRDDVNALLSELRHLLHGPQAETPHGWVRLCDLLWRLRLRDAHQIGLDLLQGPHPSTLQPHCTQPFGWDQLDGFKTLGIARATDDTPPDSKLRRWAWVPASAFLDPATRAPFIKLFDTFEARTSNRIDRAKAAALASDALFEGWRWAERYSVAPHLLEWRVGCHSNSIYSSYKRSVSSVALWRGFGVAISRGHDYPARRAADLMTLRARLPSGHPARDNLEVAPHLKRGLVDLSAWRT